jgi:hypothetical protein
VDKTIPLAVLLGVGLALPVWAAAPPPAPPWQPAVERLIAELGDRDHRRRDEAERRLRGEGVRAVPLLRKALGRPDAEVRRRVLRLIPLLEARALLAPRRLTLKVNAKPLTAVFAEITRQTGYKVLYYQNGPPGKAEGYSFDLKDVTFWEAIDTICRAANLVVQHSYGDDQVRLHHAGGHSPYVGRDGPFRYQANSFQLYRNVELGLVGEKGAAPPARTENLTFTFTLCAEPRLPLLSAGEARLDAAYDSERNSMLVPRVNQEVELMGGRMWSRRYYGGGSRQLTLQTQVNLSRPSQKATAVKLLRGVVPVTLLVEQKPMVVSDKVLAAKGKKVVVGDTQFAFDDVVKMPNNQYQLKLTITHQNKTDPNDYTWMNTLYQRMELQDAKGARYQNWGTSSSSSSNTQMNITLTYSSQGLGKVGPPTKFVYQHWTTRQHDIRFEFKDLPLP